MGQGRHKCKNNIKSILKTRVKTWILNNKALRILYIFIVFWLSIISSIDNKIFFSEGFYLLFIEYFVGFTGTFGGKGHIYVRNQT